MPEIGFGSNFKREACSLFTWMFDRLFFVCVIFLSVPSFPVPLIQHHSDHTIGGGGARGFLDCNPESKTSKIAKGGGSALTLFLCHPEESSSNTIKSLPGELQGTINTNPYRPHPNYGGR